MRLDAVDGMTKQLHKLSTTLVKGVNVDEKDDSDDHTTWRGARAPPPYVGLWSQSVSLESIAEACGSDDASFCRRPGWRYASRTGRHE